MPVLPPHSFVARLPDQGGLVIGSEPAERVSDDVIVIKMLVAGVCGTDLAIAIGARPGQAAILGHEAVGLVMAAPEECGFKPGTRVIVNPVHRKKPENVIGHSRDGIFREWFWVAAREALEGKLLVPLSPGCALRDEELALAEPIASVSYSIELLRKYSGICSLIIRGSGTIAIVAAKLWSRLIGTRAMIVSKSDIHADWLKTATQWPSNVQIFGKTDEGSLRQHLREKEAMAGILCCSREDAPEGLQFLRTYVGSGGVIDLMAGFPAEYRLEDLSIDAIRWNNSCGVSKGTPVALTDLATGKTVYLLGHRGTAEHHILQAVELLAHRAVSGDDVPQSLVSLRELPDTFGQMLARKNGHHTNWVKALVAFPQNGSQRLES